LCYFERYQGNKNPKACKTHIVDPPDVVVVITGGKGVPLAPVLVDPPALLVRQLESAVEIMEMNWDQILMSSEETNMKVQQ
jgi:hypothetical protein